MEQPPDSGGCLLGRICKGEAGHAHHFMELFSLLQGFRTIHLEYEILKGLKSMELFLLFS